MNTLIGLLIVLIFVTFVVGVTLLLRLNTIDDKLEKTNKLLELQNQLLKDN